MDLHQEAGNTDVASYAPPMCFAAGWVAASFYKAGCVRAGLGWGVEGNAQLHIYFLMY